MRKKVIEIKMTIQDANLVWSMFADCLAASISVSLNLFKEPFRRNYFFLKKYLLLPNVSKIANVLIE